MPPSEWEGEGTIDWAMPPSEWEGEGTIDWAMPPSEWEGEGMIDWATPPSEWEGTIARGSYDIIIVLHTNSPSPSTPSLPPHSLLLSSLHPPLLPFSPPPPSLFSRLQDPPYLAWRADSSDCDPVVPEAAPEENGVCG